MLGQKKIKNALISFNVIIKNYDYSDFQYRNKNQDEEIKNGIIKDIESLITIYKDRELFLYGPGTFGEKITHPDHKMVHDAFMSVERTNKNSNIHFFVYEDFPYIRQFTMANLGDFNNFLNKQENIIFEQKVIELNKWELEEKISSIYAYKSQIKAFLSFGDDLGIIAEKFSQSRCKMFLPLTYACEIIHGF